MKAVLVLATLLSAPIGPHAVAETIKLTAFSGGAIFVRCLYNDPLWSNGKFFFCRGDEDSCKSNIVSTSTEARFHQYVAGHNELQVLMTSLTAKDSGKYRCLMESNGKVYTGHKFDLEVKDDSCCGKNILRKAHVGDDVEITCKYPENNRGNTKYFYRRDRNTIFSGSTSSDSSQDTRYLISDGRANSEFNVSITRLQLKDAGLYWCGVSTGGDTGSVNLIAEVKLEVTDANGQISPENSKSTRSPSTLVYSDLDTHSFDHSTIVIVCVLLVVLVTGLVGVMVFVRKKRKEQGHSSSTAGKNDKHKTPQTECVYQEINDTSCPAVLSSELCSSRPSAAPYCSNYAIVTFHKRPGAEGQEGGSAAAPREKVTSEYATIHHRT